VASSQDRNTARNFVESFASSPGPNFLWVALGLALAMSLSISCRCLRPVGIRTPHFYLLRACPTQQLRARGRRRAAALPPACFCSHQCSRSLATRSSPWVLQSASLQLVHSSLHHEHPVVNCSSITLYAWGLMLASFRLVRSTTHPHCSHPCQRREHMLAWVFAVPRASGATWRSCWQWWAACWVLTGRWAPHVQRAAQASARRRWLSWRRMSDF
jgi:hypothetical protein